MHAWFHATLGVCLWTVLTVVFLAAAAAVLIVYAVCEKKRKAELKSQAVGNPGTAAATGPSK